MSRASSRLVYAQLALGMAIFGSATPVSKIVTEAMPVFVAATLRVALGALVLAPFALRHRGTVRAIDRADWVRIGLIALLGMFGFSVFMLYGMTLVSGVVGAIVMSTAPAVAAALSMLFLGDSPTWRKLVAIALAVTGVLVLHVTRDATGGGSEHLVAGSALILAAVVCEAAYTLLGKKTSETVDPVLVAFLAAALALPAFVPLMILQAPALSAPDVTGGAWLALAWYGAGTLALGTLLWYSGLEKAEGTIAAGFMGIMPASALILSYVLLGEPFEVVHLAGFAIVFLGVLVMSWEHARMARIAESNKVR